MLGILLGVADFDGHDDDVAEDAGDGGCGAELLRATVGFLVTLCVTVLLEVLIVVVSMRGSILNVQPRSAMPYIVYTRLGLSVDIFLNLNLNLNIIIIIIIIIVIM